MLWASLGFQANMTDTGGLIAFQALGETDRQLALIGPRLASAGAIDVSGQAVEYGIRVFEAKTLSVYLQAKAVLDSLCVAKRRCVILPVTRRNQFYDVPINQIAIKFSASISRNKAESMFRQLRFTSIPRLRIDSLNRYVVELAHSCQASSSRRGELAPPGITTAPT